MIKKVNNRKPWNSIISPRRYTGIGIEIIFVPALEEHNETPEVEWVDSNCSIEFLKYQLDEMGIKSMDAKRLLPFKRKTDVVITPFISDCCKPAVCYSVIVNQFNNAVDLGANLAAYLKSTKEYVNAYIIFIDPFKKSEAIDLLIHLIQSRLFPNPVSTIIDLVQFTGENLIIESSGTPNSLKKIHDLSELGGWIHNHSLSGSSVIEPHLTNENYECISIECVQCEQELSISTETKEKTLNKLTSFFYQHAVIESSHYYWNDLDYDYFH